MVPKAMQALEVFIEREQFPKNLSILTYTEEDEVQNYFDAEWDQQDAAAIVAATSRSRSASVEAICSSCTVTDSSSVLSVCTTPTTPAKKTIPRRISSPLVMSIVEPRSSPTHNFMVPLYRPSDLGIDLVSISGDPCRPETTN